MMKSKHKQTPQELYWERKRREEDEKDACLPPGLVNHGNTCFMNSTLQGLIATRALYALVHFSPVPATMQPAAGAGPSILARRSPQLTNGHGRGGADELAWAEGMPLGDVFTQIMCKAWDIQDARRRESMSPKEILTTIGRKYDQYLDFRQQDAHEFLRHMLDAMRMEELDIIKKRQPPPPKTKRKRRHGADPTGAASPLASPPLPASSSADLEHPLPPLPTEDAKLESFVDMLFGGQLASILVCEKCKKVSVTHEDFNDLSLSIKPEDYAKDRKRDRFKKIARKLRIRPPSSAAVHDASNGSGGGSGNGNRGRGLFRSVPRASSVPASPVRRSTDTAPHEEDPPANVDPRRRSFDHPGEPDEERDTVGEMTREARPTTPVVPAIVESGEERTDGETVQPEDAQAPESGRKSEDWTKVEAAAEMQSQEEKEKEKEKRNGKDDPWGKLARRISVSMKLSKDKERDKDSRPSSRASERGRRTDPKEFRVVRGAEPRSPRTTSLAPGASTHEPPSDAGETSDAARAAAASPVPVPVPASPRVSSSLAHASRPSSRRSSANPFKQHYRNETLTKPPVAPKLSEQELAYLRRVLADTHPVTGNPLVLLQQVLSGGAAGRDGTSSGSGNGGGGASTAALATQALWAKLGHLPGIEECLRMFTAVEILDGENMVGCHRCWKMANGTYKPRVREEGEGRFACDDSDSDSDSDEDDSSDGSGSSSAGGKSDASAAGVKSPAVPPGLNQVESSPDLSSGRVSPASTSVVSTAMTEGSSKADDTASVSSAPTTVTTAPPVTPTKTAIRQDSAMSPLQPSTFGGLPIPQISTTDVEFSELPPIPDAAKDDITKTWSSTRAVVGLSLSDDSLLTPKGRRRGRRKHKKDGVEESGSSSDDDYDDTASDTSAATSLSDGSPSASPSASPRSSVEKLVSPLASPTRHSAPSPRRVQDRPIPRAKQVVPRRMYKRYLISTPPPVLVVHLKRFQQTGRAHSYALAGGFRKLDEFVAFPEHLDLAPFLAPRREDFAPVAKQKKGAAAQERCMYRLYAVVVHIGNMLGGHYVAYTALPTPVPSAPTPTLGTPPSETAPTSPPLDARTSQSSDNPPKRQWAYISDTNVRLTTLEEVLKAKAYICMYERI